MTTITRRRLIEAAMTLAAGTAVGGCPCTPGSVCEKLLEAIRNRPTRRNIALLEGNSPTIEAFRDAVAAMKALPTSDGRNWERQAQIHQEHCPHGNWLFLPWHRAYLYYFERICRELSGMSDFALPYWHWGKSPQIPAVFWGTPPPMPCRIAIAAQMPTQLQMTILWANAYCAKFSTNPIFNRSRANRSG